MDTRTPRLMTTHLPSAALILDYRRGNGRTYRRRSDGKCVLPNDEREQDWLGIGVDLSPIQPSLTWTQPFDFIFIRCMISSFSSWPGVIAKAYENLESDGYIKLQDNVFPLKCQDGKMNDDSKPYKQDWSPITVGSGFKTMLEDAGFVDVVEKKDTWPLTPWAKDQKHKDLGYWTQESALMGIEAVSMALFTRVLGYYGVWGWKPERENKEEEGQT
ncbi:methyltransferase domain-containing protein [Colletotrichum incanum]|nr:methyltransferase domain-containing protein [Colletotrichum incanum]